VGRLLKDEDDRRAAEKADATCVISFPAPRLRTVDRTGSNEAVKEHAGVSASAQKQTFHFLRPWCAANSLAEHTLLIEGQSCP